MKVEEFFFVLNEQLVSQNHQYDRQNEGKVYIGLPSFDFSSMTQEQKIYFIYYLSFFVAFDLLVFTYDYEKYYIQKQKLNIPKFEYGLTNTFVYPNRIYDNYWHPFRSDIFKNVFKLGLDYLINNVSEFDPIRILNYSLNDKDFATGIFNIELTKEIKTTTISE